MDCSKGETHNTDVLWVVAKRRPCHALLDSPKSLRHISEFSLDHCLLNAKGNMPKYPTVFLQYFFSSPACLGSPACLSKYLKSVWIIAYLEEKELCENSQH